MTELEYGVNVANKFDLLFGDEDPTEVLNRAQDPKKKKTDAKAAPTSNVLKEKTSRSGAGKGPGADVKGSEKKPQESKKAGQDSAKPRNAPPASAQQQGQQRPPRSAQTGSARPEQGKENTSRPQKVEGGQQRSPAATGGQGQGGPRRFGNGPRPEGSAPPRRSAPMDQDFSAGGDQEVPEQRIGFGGRSGFRGGPSAFRGGRSSPRHQYPREQREGTEGTNPVHARGREFERHSGSNKTGVKPVQKREGGGAYNWGSIRDEVEIGNEAAHGAPPTTEGTPNKTEGEEGTQVEGTAPEAVAEDEAAKEPQVRELTLKEWLEEEERNRLRPKFTTRQANEGEPEQKVFQKMRRVQREKANSDGMVEVVEYVEVDVDDDGHVPAGSGGKGGCGGPFQLVFAPAQVRDERPMRGGPRGGLRGGRGGPRGGGSQRGGPGGRQAPPAPDELNFPPLG